MKRLGVGDGDEAGGDYFPSGRPLRFFHTGCKVLDCVVSGARPDGGWPLGQVVNVIGDKSVGKTLVAIEACANFARQYKNGLIGYREAEGAFQMDYAEAVGLPTDRVDFGPAGERTLWNTIEDVYEDLEDFVANCKREQVPGLYIIDSLDSLSSRSELKRKIGKDSFSLEKQKVLGELFRVLVRGMKDAEICFFIISQVRENIGAFIRGSKFKRAGGKALDFYESIELWLSHIGWIHRERNGVKRATGIDVRARTKKNKIVVSNRDCTFPIKFGFGIDDMTASLDFLAEVNQLSLLDIKLKEINKFQNRVEKLHGAEYRAEKTQVDAAVEKAWQRIESEFAPRRRKYDDD